MFIYQIQAYTLHNGEKIDEIILTVTAPDENQAFTKAKAMAERDYYHTLTVEDIPQGPVE